uniref:Uncharacterized protein n=1 Tax=Hyaloperonospora arabidopsidis (strain Emoy2) TaxID=559515 RepID=M4B376_HYAAE
MTDANTVWSCLNSLKRRLMTYSWLNPSSTRPRRTCSTYIHAFVAESCTTSVISTCSCGVKLSYGMVEEVEKEDTSRKVVCCQMLEMWNDCRVSRDGQSRQTTVAANLKRPKLLHVLDSKAHSQAAGWNQDFGLVV